jgi:hypothetical protein
MESGKVLATAVVAAVATSVTLWGLGLGGKRSSAKESGREPSGRPSPRVSIEEEHVSWHCVGTISRTLDMT